MADVDDLLREIGQLYENIVNIAMRARDAEEPMTGTQRMALIEVVRDGAMRARDLADRLATTRATTTRAIDALEELGYVERHASPGDARGVIVDATARGRRWVARREALVRAELAKLPPAAAPARLIRDLAALNAALAHRADDSAPPARLIAN